MTGVCIFKPVVICSQCDPFFLILYFLALLSFTSIMVELSCNILHVLFIKKKLPVLSYTVNHLNDGLIQYIREKSCFKMQLMVALYAYANFTKPKLLTLQ